MARHPTNSLQEQIQIEGPLIPSNRTLENHSLICAIGHQSDVQDCHKVYTTSKYPSVIKAYILEPADAGSGIIILLYNSHLQVQTLLMWLYQLCLNVVYCDKTTPSRHSWSHISSKESVSPSVSSISLSLLHSWSPQHRWWSLVLAEIRPAHWVTFILTSRPMWYMVVLSQESCGSLI